MRNQYLALPALFFSKTGNNRRIPFAVPQKLSRALFLRTSIDDAPSWPLDR